MNKKRKIVNIMQRGITPIFETFDDNEAYPIVYYTADVAVAIDYIVHSQAHEVAWLGLVDRISDKKYLIYKIYIPEQTVSAATADIESESISKLVMQIMDDGEDPSRLRYHGHSHVNMDVIPSAVDQDHMSDYLEHADWFIREIRNKKGKKKLDLFNKELGVAYQCIESDIWELVRDAAFFENIDAQLKAAVTIKTHQPFAHNKLLLSDQDADKFLQHSNVNNDDYIFLEEEKDAVKKKSLEALISDPFGVADNWDNWYNDY